MKVVFLDIDGVLVNRESLMEHCGLLAEAHPDCVKALNFFLDQTHADIVISSTWRFANNERFRGNNFLEERLSTWGVRGKIIGMTPRLNGDITRGQEILAWCEENGTPDKMVILDDDTDVEPFLNSLVKTIFEVGLTMKDANLAIKIFNCGGIHENSI